ncbi:uncharacterized protein LOC118442073 isoform X1 [Vespa mandarinia]|uniref:uncharacterized protein LOC118442073 isoform X1 n=1 Tax=Vespa mandarinia TaxID=7446 RepID=UPI001611E736|nr:uncharacterized protein LOC118442073 isoform X1 [Vespa mandarinia]XP_035723146.1 uncharacterized protein LOC118442073 isoform X1 [Vespa mandarinia]XP_046831951.1 uncharacterized protein LOC124430010 isoform X1 [Vespa crabro]XP_046831952.1 uncharacterized protein LOC124430010 isoform X1 [Vespa crabro]XP_047364477.1 uncharacterized protein LOC124954899 isoform X1 [Vespa velutina]XP_047364478.1 uncharacterized protein LOC124954899 isoform X1 [Vespa velutina]XP_047364480.1 uncharacterized prot
MTSKVLMKLPTVPFSQGKKPSPHDITLNERNDGMIQTRQQNMNIDRAAQLEQNMKFLQEQHQATLLALHQEVETLRQRNRDLQFQLIFSKGTTCVPSSPSSPEDNGNGFAKPKGSPVCVNVTPLQVELLEKDLQDIKASLQDAKTHNQCLTEIIDQQKKNLEELEKQKKKIDVTDVGIQVGGKSESSQEDIVTRLADAHAVIKQLHRENTDQRKEIATLKAASANNGGTSRGGWARDSNNSHHSRVSSITGIQESTSHKFPPLQTQSYSHRRIQSFDHNSDYHRNGRNRYDRQDLHTDAENTALPQLQNGSINSDAMIFDSCYRRYQAYLNYHREYYSNRKYRCQGSQRDRRDSENRYYRRDYKDRKFKDHQRGECTDSGEGSRDADSSHNQ